jgi:hypothetical protein
MLAALQKVLEESDVEQRTERVDEPEEQYAFHDPRKICAVSPVILEVCELKGNVRPDEVEDLHLNCANQRHEPQHLVVPNLCEVAPIRKVCSDDDQNKKVEAIRDHNCNKSSGKPLWRG